MSLEGTMLIIPAVQTGHLVNLRVQFRGEAAPVHLDAGQHDVLVFCNLAAANLHTKAVLGFLASWSPSRRPPDTSSATSRSPHLASHLGESMEESASAFPLPGVRSQCRRRYQRSEYWNVRRKLYNALGPTKQESNNNTINLCADATAWSIRIRLTEPEHRILRAPEMGLSLRWRCLFESSITCL